MSTISKLQKYKLKYNSERDPNKKKLYAQKIKYYTSQHGGDASAVFADDVSKIKQEIEKLKSNISLGDIKTAVTTFRETNKNPFAENYEAVTGQAYQGMLDIKRSLRKKGTNADATAIESELKNITFSGKSVECIIAMTLANDLKAGVDLEVTRDDFLEIWGKAEQIFKDTLAVVIRPVFVDGTMPGATDADKGYAKEISDAVASHEVKTPESELRCISTPGQAVEPVTAASLAAEPSIVVPAATAAPVDTTQVVAPVDVPASGLGSEVTAEPGTNLDASGALQTSRRSSINDADVARQLGEQLVIDPVTGQPVPAGQVSTRQPPVRDIPGRITAPPSASETAVQGGGLRPFKAYRRR